MIEKLRKLRTPLLIFLGFVLGILLIPSVSIAARLITSIDIARQAVVTPKIAPGAVVNPKLADHTVTGDKIAPHSITTPKIAPGAVITGKITDGSVTHYKLSYGAKLYLKNFTTHHGSKTFDFSSIAAGNCTTGTVTNLNCGVTLGNSYGVVATPRPATGGVEDSLLFWDSWVSADDEVTIRVCNPTAGAIDPDSQDWDVYVLW